ncbi:MAG: amidase family protein, partial [Actinomycetes bacterium]
SLGHHVESVPFPGDMRFGKDFLRFWGMMAKLIQIGGKRFFGPEFDRSLLEPSTKGLCKYFTSVAFNAPASVLRLRSFAQEFEQSFVDHDVLLSPVLSSEPVPIGVLAPDSDFHELMIRLVRYVRYTALQNVSGAPAISLPLGRGSSGLPIGVQFAAAYGQDRRLIELAYELEAAAPWRYASSA